MVKPFIAGNWKMFKSEKEAIEFAEEFKKVYISSDVKVGVFANYLSLKILKKAFEDTDIIVGAQDMHWQDEGAYTGAVSGQMLLDIGIKYSIIGHSERREYFGETDETVNLKLKKAFELDIKPIMCIGENLEQREKGIAFEIIKNQIKKGLAEIKETNLSNLTIAYEPIWAIGTGKTATSNEANEMCEFIRDVLSEMFGEDNSMKVTLQYGGSVKPENVTEIMNMPEIDGALVGGASLKVDSFLEIVNF